MHCKRKNGLEEMTVTFESISLAELGEIIRRLNALPWVSAASLHLATGAARRDETESELSTSRAKPVGEE